MNTSVNKFQFSLFFTALFQLATLLGCTGQIPGSYRFLQQEQVFKTAQDVNTKIDLLWVVDNSSSMDVHQKKLRDGFQAFASKYLKPTWDIRLTVITTDTYLAHSAFSDYLSTTVPGSVGYASSYLSGLSWLSSYKNPSWAPHLVNTSTGNLDNGLTYGNLNPLWGPDYALLKPGIHDGPMTAFCFEGMPFFLKGVTQCGIRDHYLNYSGPDHCISPNESAGESSLSQCVNTIQNDTVRSGKAIISTVPPTGVPGDSQWISQIQKEFIINASVGSSGSGSERGLSSVIQLLNDNEKTSTAFFRQNSLRGIIFLTDEDDQSLEIPSTLPSHFSPDWGYKCDQASLLSDNGNSSLVDGNNGLCSNDSTKNSKYGSLGISCPGKTIDNYSYTPGICPDTTKLLSVSGIKSQIDQFFHSLDQSSSSDPNYFVAVITPLTGQSVESIQKSRRSINTSVGTLQVVEAGRGDRYIELANSVGGGSLQLDITSSEYSAVLDAIGKEIVEKKSTFQLQRAPTNKEEMVVTIIHADGTSTVVSNDQYIISDKNIKFINQDFVLSLSLTDKVSINYQPKTAY